MQFKIRSRINVTNIINKHNLCTSWLDVNNQTIVNLLFRHMQCEITLVILITMMRRRKKLKDLKNTKRCCKQIICLFVGLFACLLLCLCLFVYLFVYLFICLFVCLFLRSNGNISLNFIVSLSFGCLLYHHYIQLS